MPSVNLRKVSKRFGKVTAVNEISIDIAGGEFVTLLGPSGCGKTTTLRMIAGLERNDAGEILFDGQIVSLPEKGIFIPPNKRNIGMVFQSYAIWPHMTVFQNVAYPLVNKGVPKNLIKEKVFRTLELVGLDGMADRPAPRLSGGQQQRVALARAIIFEPQLLLLDEPLSNLDAKLREEMRFELRELQQKLGLTAIYVTHDQEESMVMSDRIIVMNHGFVEQQGVAEEIYERPATRFVATFVGRGAVVRGQAVGEEEVACVTYGRVRCPELGCEIYVSQLGLSKDNGLFLCIKPEKIALCPTDLTPADFTNSFEAEVVRSSYLGDRREYEVVLGSTVVRFNTSKDCILQKGQAIRLAINPRDIITVSE